MVSPKEKRCVIGTGKARGFKGCGDSTYHRIYGLCEKACYPKWLLTTEAGNLKIEKATLKASKPRRELEKAAEETKRNKSLSTLLINVRTVCHTYIKKRDYGKPCISCGKPWHKDFQAGHYYKAELYSTLKFNEYNIHGQCEGCNIRKEGNLSEYAVNLPKRIGLNQFDVLNDLAGIDHQHNFKWDRFELNKIRDYYKNLIKQYETNI
jgi:hypothetical protein